MDRRNGQTGSRYMRLITGLITAGAYLRVLQYGYDRSLWLDEAKFALKVRDFSYGQLFFPELQATAAAQIKAQAAPVGFFYLSKAMTQLFGNHEMVLRAIPLVCGVATLILFYKIAVTMLGRAAAAVALALLAFNSALIYFSSDFHQYASDALITAGILFMGLKMSGSVASRRSALACGLTGAVLVWCSYPAFFVLCGVGLALMICPPEKEIRRQALVSTAMWAGSFAACYFLYVRYFIGTDYIGGYWRAYMLAPPFDGRDKFLFAQAFASIMTNGHVCHTAHIRILFVLTLVGAVALLRRKPLYFFMAGFPVFFALLASMMGKYPVFFRTAVFSIPLLLLFIGEGAGYMVRLFPQRTRKAVMGGLIVLMFYPAAVHMQEMFLPKYREEIKPCISVVAKNREDGDQLYVYYGAGPAFDYYRSRYELNGVRILEGKSRREDPSMGLQEIATGPGSGRVWLLFTHVRRYDSKLIRKWLNSAGTRLLRIPYPGAAIELYDMTHNGRESQEKAPLMVR